MSRLTASRNVSSDATSNAQALSQNMAGGLQQEWNAVQKKRERPPHRYLVVVENMCIGFWLYSGGTENGCPWS